MEVGQYVYGDRRQRLPQRANHALGAVDRHKYQRPALERWATAALPLDRLGGS